MELIESTFQKILRPEPRYVDTAESAKLVRAALKKEFPQTKFSVRISRYSMGSSIHVSYTDGPNTSEVNKIADQFCGGRFDSTIDLSYSVSSWLYPDGSASVAHDPGTQGGAGSCPEIMVDPKPGAELVRFA